MAKFCIIKGLIILFIYFDHQLFYIMHMHNIMIVLTTDVLYAYLL